MKRPAELPPTRGMRPKWPVVDLGEPALEILHHQRRGFSRPEKPGGSRQHAGRSTRPSRTRCASWWAAAEPASASTGQSVDAHANLADVALEGGMDAVVDAVEALAPGGLVRSQPSQGRFS